jgi:hypothetical protein
MKYYVGKHERYINVVAFWNVDMLNKVCRKRKKENVICEILRQEYFAGMYC